MKQTFWIVRHGERQDFVDPKIMENIDTPRDIWLSENGRQQAKDLANRLKDEGISHIFASPFQRTIETANFSSKVLNLPIKAEPGLGEMMSLDWFTEEPKRVPWVELLLKFPSIDTNYVNSGCVAYFPETKDELKKRARETMKYINSNYDGDILLVTHGATMKALAKALTDENQIFQGDFFCNIIKIVVENGEWKVELNGDISHLSFTERTL